MVDWDEIERREERLERERLELRRDKLRGIAELRVLEATEKRELWHINQQLRELGAERER